MFSPISVFDIRNRRNIHTSCRTASTFPFRSILFRIPHTGPTHFQLSSTFPRNNLGNVVLGLVWSLEIVWRSQLEYGMCATADSFLDLDISYVLVVDDHRHTDLSCCFNWDMVRSWSHLDPRNWVYSTIFYGFSPSSSLSFVVFFSSSGYRSFVHSFTAFFLSSNIHFLPSSLFISPREDQTIPRLRQFLLRPTQAIVRYYAWTPIEIDTSFSGVIVWRYLWRIRMEHGHRLEHFLEYCS